MTLLHCGATITQSEILKEALLADPNIINEVSVKLIYLITFII